MLFTTNRTPNLPDIHINNQIITKANTINFLCAFYDDSIIQTSHKLLNTENFKTQPYYTKSRNSCLWMF